MYVMRKFEVLSPEMTARIEYENRTGTYARVGFDNGQVIRRKNVAKDNDIVWRPPFVHDIDKIMHSPYFNRYADKTQVYSLCKNDDLTRRNLHVQLVELGLDVSQTHQSFGLDADGEDILNGEGIAKRGLEIVVGLDSEACDVVLTGGEFLGQREEIFGDIDVGL